jgi:HD-GYP domain-containing protein (c-di-GMP phosphodiesterase class II)/anti-anti-sigma regulatory factor
MVRTAIERVEVEKPDTAAFRIAGKLGYHEKTKIAQLIDECNKRNFRNVIFDFSDVASLGGGVAKLLREFVRTVENRGGSVAFVVKNEIILKFLKSEDEQIWICPSLEEALGGGGARAAAQHASAQDHGVAEGGHGGAPGPVESGEERTPQSAGAVAPEGGGEGAENPNVILMSYSGGAEQASAAIPAAERPTVANEGMPAPGTRPPDEDTLVESERVITEIFKDDTSSAAQAIEGARAKEYETGGEGDYAEINRSLKRRIFGYKTLFSISADFSAVRDKKKLLDIFLLTSIAQGGVESAVFCERKGERFEVVMSKGLESEAAEDISITVNEVKITGDGRNVIPIDSFNMNEKEQEDLKEKGFQFICPFTQNAKLVGLVLLGKRIAGRGMRKEDFEFLSILINITQAAYENAVSFERGQDRTLGIVKTLISLIEDNTLLKGTSEFVSRYVGMVAKDMNYPEERFKDLIYGTVLRDMGMIKISDLILRSPRDLTKEEWGVIKKHPEDGAEMLRRMQFSEDVVEIVRSHHERFNGEGYPRGLRGKDIPLGARIISVVESYAAMISERPNRPARSEREALDSLKENYGLRYDREVVMRFVKIMEKEMAKSVASEKVAQ